ncbi:MAG: Sugar transporter permease YjfF [Anaerolineales bacterium]|nr:Sugar ABC transporter permease YjfF [Anaerolineales bacterium]MBM2842187.1 Sugar transporter permease YjfF [Anaerolineales bacterium]
MRVKAAALVANNQRFIPLLATALLAFAAYVVGAFLYPGMRDPQVFFNILTNNSYLLISSVGMTLVILSGGIDLSVSGVIALTTVATAAMLREGANPWLVVLVVLLMGMALGATMGGFIAYLKVQPFIATLAGMWFARGMCFFISDDAIAIDHPFFRILALTRLLIPGLSDPVAQRGDFITILTVIAFLVLAVVALVAQFTKFGRSLYAIGGDEQSARLMGLPVPTTKVMVYTFNGFCSALAGIVLAAFVASGHGLYASGYELRAIAAVVMGGTSLAGGSGYVLGTLFGVLILGITQTLIQFNGNLSSWWTNIVIGLLTFVFIAVQSVLVARRGRRRRALAEAGAGGAPSARRRRRMWAASAAVVGVAALAAFLVRPQDSGAPAAGTEAAGRCLSKPFRQELADSLVQAGALLAYERNGGPRCLDEIYAIYPDGLIVGDNGIDRIEKPATVEAVTDLLARIRDHGWFTAEMYNTWHNPCGQCYGYYITVSDQGETKTVRGVDGGTDAPADYWQVVSLIKGIIPEFEAGP